MAYVYGWFENSKPFYFGYSSNNDGIYRRANRCRFKYHSGTSNSSAEQYYYKMNSLKKNVIVKIMADDLTKKEATILESCLILTFKSILKNDTNMLIYNLPATTKTKSIDKLVKKLIKMIRTDIITADNQTTQIKTINFISITYNNGDLLQISPESFKEKFNISINIFLKQNLLSEYNIQNIEVENVTKIRKFVKK